MFEVIEFHDDIELVCLVKFFQAPNVWQHKRANVVQEKKCYNALFEIWICISSDHMSFFPKCSCVKLLAAKSIAIEINALKRSTSDIDVDFRVLRNIAYRFLSWIILAGFLLCNILVI